ncbi:MAG: methylmalonyl-CoA epimerase [Gemmatimonadetes bacterium]|nr:methylmalonyl-CoA epimerase [Gemmatimonadota bacterium]
MTSPLAATRPLDHVAVAVHSIEESRSLFEFLSGGSCTPPETLETQGVRVAFVGAVELLEPLGPDTTVGRFLERHGQGLHHIAYRTQDLEGDLARLDAEGVPLIDRVPRMGARGHRVAFLHPSGTGGVLVELVERPA